MEVEILDGEIIVGDATVVIPNLLIDALKEYATKRKQSDTYENISYADLYCFRAFVQATEYLTQEQYNAIIKELGFPIDFLKD